MTLIQPGCTLGILGGGQLGRMTAMAAQHLGYKVIGFTSENNSPLSQVCSKTYCAAFEDEAALVAFANEVDVVTIEFENIPALALETIERYKPVRPSPQVLYITQNRLREKNFLSANNFPVVPYAAINTIEDLEAAIKTIGLPAVLKTAGFGYDGKGQRMIKAMSDVDADKVPALPAIIEKFIPFKKEISIIGARSENGKFAAHGPIENQHQNHILDVSFAPAVVSPVVIEQALAITQKVMEGLNVIGLLCVEFFLMQDDTLLINELAPRPHNSGHLTIESCAASQFEQLVRTVTGLPLGSTVQNHAAAMANLLGDVWNNGEPKWSAALSLPDVHLHLYGKEQPRPGRKMGHIAACASTVEQAKAQVIEARSLLCK